LVLSGFLDAVVSLLDEVEWLRHVLLVLDELLELSLLFGDLEGGLVGLFNVSLFFSKTGKLSLLIFLELSSPVLSLTQVLLELSQHLGGGA